MPVCTNECVVRVDSRTKETSCFHHGTLTFVREPHDIVDNSDQEKGLQFKYSDRFLINAVRSSPLTLEELSTELGVSRKTLFRVRKRAGVV